MLKVVKKIVKTNNIPRLSIEAYSTLDIIAQTYLRRIIMCLLQLKNISSTKMIQIYDIVILARLYGRDIVLPIEFNNITYKRPFETFIKNVNGTIRYERCTVDALQYITEVYIINVLTCAKLISKNKKIDVETINASVHLTLDSISNVIPHRNWPYDVPGHRHQITAYVNQPV